LGSSASDFNLPAGVATDGTSIYVVDSNPSRVGGIAGFLDKGGIIQNSYNTGSVVGSSTNNFSNDIGGVVGYSKGLVSNTYSTGNIDGGINLGGLVGYNAGQLEHSFSTGSVTGDSDYYERVGPLLGHQDYLNYGVSVSNYFQNNWTVTAGSTCLSASVGVECNSAIALGNSLVSGGQDQVLANFYDGQEFPFRDYNGGSPIIYWDFTNIWDETATFPTLKD
jgi:hypothetical protein